MKKAVAFLSLFTSAGTLLCCALPALFVALGFGAAFAGIVGNVPQLIWLSERKVWIFSVGAIMLATGGLIQWSASNKSCPTDASLADACSTTKDWSKVTYIASVVIYVAGAFFAFVAPIIF